MDLGSCGGLEASPTEIECLFASRDHQLVDYGTRAEMSSLIQLRHSVSARIGPIVIVKHSFDSSIAIYFGNGDLCFGIRLSCLNFFSLTSLRLHFFQNFTQSGYK